MNTFELVIMLLILEKILTAIQITSADMQSMKIDVSKATNELEKALSKIRSIPDKWDKIKM